MNRIKLVEGTHYRRRFNQPAPPTRKSRELVSCLFCDTSSYSRYDEEHGVENIDDGFISFYLYWFLCSN